LHVASITQHNATMPAGPRKTKISEQDKAQFNSRTKGRGEPRNLDDFAVVSHRILQTRPPNLTKCFAENCGPTDH